MLKKLFSKIIARAAHIHLKSGAEAAFDGWVNALCSANPERVVAFYAEDAILNATLSPTPMATQAERFVYFEKITRMPGIKVRIESQHLRMFGDMLAVVSGLYAFEFMRDGEQVKIPARYSFVFQRNNNGDWLVIDHHSSCLPESVIN